MKKTLAILFLFLLQFGKTYAQNFNYGLPKYENLDKHVTIDSAYIKCTYMLTYLKDTLELQEKSGDKQVLLIGKIVSKYYSQYKLDYYYFLKKEIKKGTANVPTIPQKGAWSYELFKNYPLNKETVTDISSILQTNFLYEEDLPVFNWKISNENQTILSYNCRKATVSFRGRDFIAWFAPDIPVSNGPWKFGGLPGLILKLYDTKNNFVFECQGIEQMKQKEPIMFYKVDYTKISRKDLEKLYRRYHDDYAAYLVETTGKGMYVVDTQTNKATYTEHSSWKIPYNPIELE